jgi:hypothetical protein
MSITCKLEIIKPRAHHAQKDRHLLQRPQEEKYQSSCGEMHERFRHHNEEEIWELD